MRRKRKNNNPIKSLLLRKPPLTKRLYCTGMVVALMIAGFIHLSFKRRSNDEKTKRLCGSFKREPLL